MDFQGTAGSPKVNQSVHHGDRVFSVKALVHYLDDDILARLLQLQRYVVILSLLLVNKTIRTVINSSSVPLTTWYQNFKTRLGVILFVRLGCLGAVITALLMVPSYFLTAVTVMTASIRLIQRCKFAVRFRISLFILGYVRHRIEDISNFIFYGTRLSSAIILSRTIVFLLHFDTYLF